MSSRVEAAEPGALRLLALQVQIGRWLVRGFVAAVVLFILGWVGYKASSDVPTFYATALDGLTLGGLYFIVASGFTLIFGLMRVVNMAHGSLYLLGGYIAFTIERDVSGNWLFLLVVAALSMAIVGLVMQQLFLRWNQGQDLRQALITIAISIILADQMLEHFGGLAQVDITTPKVFDRAFNLAPYEGLGYPVFRMFILGIAIAIVLGLWLVIKRTRLGMIVRAGVDDRAMVSALGINIQLVFALAFFVGSLLAGLGGAFGGTMIAIGPGEDADLLIRSLIVVIIGGMGSLGGAAIGAAALGLVENFSALYLPIDYTNYSILLTFILLVFVLAVRPLGLFGRPA